MCLTKSKDYDNSDAASISSAVSESFVNKFKFKKDRETVSVTEPTFLIVGAGAAGIACAVSLLKKGFRCVTIIEAENRIGGRIFTKSFGYNIVELGAQWCHGQKGNIVYEKTNGKIMLHSSSHIYTNFDCVRSDGEVLPNELVQKLKNLLAHIFAARHQELASVKGTFGEYLTKNFNIIISKKEYQDVDRVIAREFFENFIKIERGETAGGLEELSAQGFDNYVACDGDYLLHFENGFNEFLSILLEADELGNDLGVLEDKIIFGIRVNEIIWDRTDFKVEVTCENTSASFLVDHVIVTVSLGVLKRNARLMFDPPLPKSKQRAIDGLGFGSIMKMYLEFPSPFWNSKWTGVAMLWREADLPFIRESKRAWVEDVYGFYRVPNQPCVLVGWLVGSRIPLVEAMPNTEVTDGCMYLLRRFLPNNIVPDPVDFIKSSWDTNPNFYGSSSFRSLKTEELTTGAAELAQPITVLAEAPNFKQETQLRGGLAVKPLIQFAGEATHERYFGTVHGAVESGVREAKRLEGYYSIDL